MAEEEYEGAKTTVADIINFPKTWEFEGKSYDLFLVNKTGGIGMPVVHPQDDSKVIGQLNAEFAWTQAEPFLERLDIETIDKAASDDDWTDRENTSLMQKNAVFFSQTIVRGSSIDIDEGERKPEQRKTREQMLAYRKPVQSDLVNHWLREFHVERWLPEGMNSLDAYLSASEEIYFTAKIGSMKKPRHLLLFKFRAPSDDAISAYQNDSFTRGQNSKGDWRFARNNGMRFRFAKKYLVSVQGAMLGPVGGFEFDESELRPVAETDDASIREFKSGFNPDWWVRMSDELASVFNLGKK